MTKQPLTPEQVRSILNIPSDESAARAFEFMRRWQEIRLKKSWGTLTLRLQDGKEVHAEQYNSF